MYERVYLSPPDVGSLEERHVVEVLRSGWVAPVGPALDAFEREVADRVGVAHAVAVSSGTAALHLALVALGVGPGDAVVVPTFTFMATANAVLYTGAQPVFVDCDAGAGNLDPELTEALLSDLRAEGRRVAAVIPVDMFGACADYATLLPICERYGVPVVEDAAEALGSIGPDGAAGSFGRAAALSFNGNKIITTSGGGMVLSDDAALVAQCRYLSTQARQPVPHYEHTEVGYNYRLSNLLAALGRAQLSRLDSMMERRRSIREQYAKAFAGIDGVRLIGADDTGSNAWLTNIVVDAARTGWQARDLGAHLAALNIETRMVWKPMHRQPVFDNCRSALNGTADRLFATGLTLPSGSALTEEQINRVLTAIAEFVESPQGTKS